MGEMERLNITLADEEAAKLWRLAERMRVQPGMIARSLLARALEEADPDSVSLVELLDGIPGAYERARQRPAPGPRRRYRRARRAVARDRRGAGRHGGRGSRPPILTHSLPVDTRSRVARSLRLLERFPLMGPALTGRWEGFRFVLGPWRWLLLVYVFIEPEDRVVVVTIQDARSSAAATTER